MNLLTKIGFVPRVYSIIAIETWERFPHCQQVPTEHRPMSSIGRDGSSLHASLLCYVVNSRGLRDNIDLLV